MSDSSHPLRELGENAIVASLISRFLGAHGPDVVLGVGDDAAILRPQDSTDLVVTIDACPTPVVQLLGQATWEDWGRLAGVISLSDLAAMGAEPVAFLSATAMPPEMTSDEYTGFLSGLDAVCSEWNMPIVGGNIREASTFSATTVAIGRVAQGRAFLRSTARANDRLIAVGRIGVFWSGVLRMRSGATRDELSESQRQALWQPEPRLAASKALQEARVVTAALDCSDGLGAAVETMAIASGLGALLDFSGVDFDPCLRTIPGNAGIESLALSWGDWQLLVAVAPEHVDQALERVHASGSPGAVIGTLTEQLGLRLVRNGRVEELADRLGSVRFEPSSYLVAGLDSYATRLENAR